MKHTPFALPATLMGWALISACALPITASAQVPAALAPPDNERAAFTFKAVGTQNYECRFDAGKFAWVFVAPEAELLSEQGDKVGTHGAGPHWAALDGSKTVGTVKARANAQRAADIPLLLLTTKSDGGAGKMANVTSIQRLNTRGGIAQAGGCDTARDVGKRSKERYTADYVFFTAQ